MQIQSSSYLYQSYNPYGDKKTQEENKKSDLSKEKSINGEELSAEQELQVRELEAIDRNVKAHEAAHIAAGAGVVNGGATYSYTRGPDGKMYATAGEVPISMKKGDTPEETIQNARQIIAAALAPADPSPQDYKVAASAAQMEMQARSEQAQERAQELKESLKKSDNGEEKEVDSQKKESFFEDLKRENALKAYKQNANSISHSFEIAS